MLEGGTQAVMPEISSNRFPKSARLNCPAEFSQAFSARQVVRGRFFDLHYRLCSNPSWASDTTLEPVEAGSMPAGARLGLVIAKKLARRAVQRNLLKRLVREHFRCQHSLLPPVDMILRLAKTPGHDLGPEARRAWSVDIENLFQRLQRRLASATRVP